jgi:hypothetical protein
MSKIDGNSRYVAFGVDPDGNPKPIAVDSVTGYVCASASIGSPAGPTDTQTVDENSRGTSTGVNPDGDNQVIATNSNGEIYTTAA